MDQGEKQWKITSSWEDLEVEILSRLDVESLLRFKCVCKSWYDLIKSPFFIRKHLQRTTENNNHLVILKACDCVFDSTKNRHDLYSVDPKFPNQAKTLYRPFKYCGDVVFGGSWNGLVCLSFKFGNYDEEGVGDVWLWNPATREEKLLPANGFSSEFLCGGLVGLSFDPNSDEYKVVRVVYFRDFDRKLKNEVMVYTLGSDEWRRLGDIPYYIDHGMNRMTARTIVNGNPHWLASRSESTSSDLLIFFDSAREAFEEMPQPNYTSESGYKMSKQVGSLGGCLSVYWYFPGVVIWVMKEYGIKESWTKQFVLVEPAKYCLAPLKPLRLWPGGGGDSILLELRCMHALIFYNLEGNKLTEIKVQGLPPAFHPYYPYYHMESLVSLTVGSQRNTNKEGR